MPETDRAGFARRHYQQYLAAYHDALEREDYAAAAAHFHHALRWKWRWRAATDGPALTVASSEREVLRAP